MITIKIDEADVQYTVEGKGVTVLAESGVAITNIIRVIREIKDDDRFIKKMIELAVKQEKEME